MGQKLEEDIGTADIAMNELRALAMSRAMDEAIFGEGRSCFVAALLRLAGFNSVIITICLF